MLLYFYAYVYTYNMYSAADGAKRYRLQLHLFIMIAPWIEKKKGPKKLSTPEL